MMFLWYIPRQTSQTHTHIYIREILRNEKGKQSGEKQTIPVLMARKQNFAFYFLLLAICVVDSNPAGANERIVPAIFIFGDSAIDIGTNNFLNSYAKANFRYNGIDFPYSKATGRFSNGYNIGDQLGKASIIFIDDLD